MSNASMKITSFRTQNIVSTFSFLKCMQRNWVTLVLFDSYFNTNPSSSIIKLEELI